MSKLSTIQNQDLAALLMSWRDEVFNTLNCHQLGTIASFDAAKQTAQVTLNVQRTISEQVRTYPILVDVPVFVPSGGPACLTLPIAAGDTCLVLFNDRDIDNWFTTGAAAPPNSARIHSLADGLAIVGFRSRRNPVVNYSTTDAELRHGNAAIGLDGTKISIRNDTTSLRTALDALMVALTGWVNTGGSTPNSTTVTALTAAKALIDAVLK